MLHRIRNKEFYICDYTGAPINTKYFIPCKGEEVGCYASLPVLLRHQFELLGDGPSFEEVKREVEDYWNQPDIPLAPVIEEERVPLTRIELDKEMVKLPMGLAWYFVEKPKLKKAKKGR